MTDVNDDDAVEPGSETDPASAATAEAADAVDAALESELTMLANERDELLDTARRVQAEFENYKKRMMRDQTALVERASESLVEQLLPVLDSFELALVQVVGSDIDEKVSKGIELTYAELLGVLERAGLERIDAKGAPFDPNEHEAVLQDDGDGEPHVGDVLRTGWKLKGRVLRPAMVKVTRA